MKKLLPGLPGLLIVFHLSAQPSVKVIKTHTEKDVIPEGITVDPANGTIYVSSIYLKKIIDRENELFHDPTTAAVLGNKLYVLANSYLGEYNANKETASGITDKLGPVTVLVYELK